MDWTLELIVLPASDIDRAKEFYLDRVGFDLHVDHRGDGDFRVVQLTPHGSACSIALMRNDSAPVQGLHLVVQDLAAAREELVARGVEVSEPFHYGDSGQQPGLHPERKPYASFCTFADPDGNVWLVQDVRR